MNIYLTDPVVNVRPGQQAARAPPAARRSSDWLLHDRRDVLAAERTSFHKMICLAPHRRPTE